MSVKVLLDESVPRQLSRCFPDSFDVYTVQDMGWSGRANGELLQLANSHLFDSLVTVDKGFQFQQNLEFLPVPVIIMIAPRIHFRGLHPLVPKVVSVLSSKPTYDIYRVHA